LLAILAAGFYFNAALGFNAFTLRVQERVGPVFAINTFAAVVGVVSTTLLSAWFGALGAAVGVTLTLVLHNLLNHAGLLVVDIGVRLLDVRFLRIYVVIAAMAGTLAAIQELLSPPIHVSVALTGLAWLGVIRLTRAELDPATTFPELMRIPLARRLLR
jgi:O-antigen/teichoic acid export membrane protein